MYLEYIFILNNKIIKLTNISNYFKDLFSKNTRNVCFFSIMIKIIILLIIIYEKKMKK